MWSPLYQAGYYGEREFSVHWLFAAYQEQVSKMYLFTFTERHMELLTYSFEGSEHETFVNRASK